MDSVSAALTMSGNAFLVESAEVRRERGVYVFRSLGIGPLPLGRDPESAAQAMAVMVLSSLVSRWLAQKLFPPR